MFFLVLTNATCPSHLILDPLEYYSFTYPSLLHLCFSFRFSRRTFPYTFVFPTSATFPASFFLLDLFIRKIFVKEKISRNYSLRNMLQPSGSSSVFVKNLLLSTPLYFTFCLCPTKLIIITQPQISWSIALKMKCISPLILQSTCLCLFI